MSGVMKYLALFVLCSLVALCWSLEEQGKLSSYVVTTVLPDGEQEIRIKVGKTLVRETFVTHEEDGGHRRGLMLRQLASGPHFLQLIYKLDNEVTSGEKLRTLAECEIVTDWPTTNKFRRQFRHDLQKAGLEHLQVPKNKHEDLEVISHDDLPIDDDIELQLNQLDDHGTEISEIGGFDADPLDLYQGLEEFRNVTVKLFHESQMKKELRTTIDLRGQRRRCRRLHRKMQSSVKAAQKGENQQGRKKREAFRVGIMPGTLWCGDGSIAEKYQSVGAHVGTDRCCRIHDGCPFIIDAMSTKYGLFNYRMHTLSHCACDERFRSCLKQTNTGAANMVGKIFFNVVQTKCFLLKAEKKCTKMSWWGRCLKYEHKKQAHLREPIPY